MIWRPGDTAVQRFVHTDDGAQWDSSAFAVRVGQHHPMRVLSDDGDRLIGWMPAGTDIVNTRLADGRDPREAPLDQMFLLPRVRLPGKWLDTHTVRLVTESEWSSVWWFFTEDYVFHNWYVNLEIPRGRTSFSTDRVWPAPVLPAEVWSGVPADQVRDAGQHDRGDQHT